MSHDPLDNEYAELIQIDRRAINNGFYVPSHWNAGTVVIEPPAGCGGKFEKRIAIRPDTRELFTQAGFDIDWQAPEVKIQCTVLLKAYKPGHYTISEVIA